MTVIEWMQNGGYERMRQTLARYETNRDGDLDEDIYHDTLTKMLMKEKYKDTTEQGYDNYCFKAYRINVMRESQYPRNSRTVYVDDITPYQTGYNDGEEWSVYDAIKNEFGEARLNLLIEGYDDNEILNWLKKNV